MTMEVTTIMQLHPLEDRIVVRPNGAEATTASGLVIPDTAKEKPQQGKVVAVGKGKVGDDGKVHLYNRLGSTHVAIDADHRRKP